MMDDSNTYVSYFTDYNTLHWDIEFYNIAYGEKNCPIEFGSARVLHVPIVHADDVNKLRPRPPVSVFVSKRRFRLSIFKKYLRPHVFTFESFLHVHTKTQ